MIPRLTPCRPKKHRYAALPAIVLMQWTLVAAVRAHGDPVFVSLDASGDAPRLTTDKLIYADYNEHVMELFLGVILQAELPGYSVQPGSALPAGAQLSINVVDKLWYSNGAEVLDAPVTLRLEDSEGASVFVTKDTGPQPGIFLGTYDGTVAWHEHPYYSLEPTSAPAGLYGLKLEIAAPGYAPSEPFLIVWRNGLADSGAHFDRVVQLAAHALPVPGDVNFDGTVDIFDVALVSAHWSETGPTADANADMAVDIFDVAVISGHWGETVGGLDLNGAAAVPEPATLSLAGIALVAGGVAACVRARFARKRKEAPMR